MASPVERAAPGDAVRVQVIGIPRGYRGTRQTVAEMARLIREGAKNLSVRQHAVAVLRGAGVPAKDYLGEIRALFRWVQRNVRYTRDPHRVETLHGAHRMLQFRAGDCDDMTILLGALLKSIGHPVRIVITGSDARRPHLFSHVYLEAFYRGLWIPLDATMPHLMGWAPRSPVRERFAVEPSPSGQGVTGAFGFGIGRCACPRSPESRHLVDRAWGLHRRFTGRPPDAARVVRHPRLMPPVVTDLGELVGVVYRSDKWAPGRPRTYVHFMDDRPHLVTDPSGRQLYVVGGRYQVTERGIEG